MKKLLMAFAILCSVSAMSAEPDYYAALCAWAPGQLPMAKHSVIWGVRGTLFYGDHTRLNGVDLAIGANRTREEFNGFALAGVYNYANNANGVQWGFANIVENEFAGFQWGSWNHARFCYGTQWGDVNTTAYFEGFQWGSIWNRVWEGYGVQWGFVNTANYFAGFQMGFLNWAHDLDGFQLGLINVVVNQPVCVLPFLNIGF